MKKPAREQSGSQVRSDDKIGWRSDGFWKGMAFTLGSAVLWGSTYPSISVALTYYNAFDISLFRAVLATLTLTIFFVFKGRIHEMIPRRKDLPLLLLGSIFGASGFWTLLNIAVLYLEPDTASFLLALYPLVAIVLATLVLHEKMTMIRAAGVMTGVIGTFIIVVIGESAGFTGSQPLVGSLIAIVAAFFWGGYMITTRILIGRNKASGENIQPEYVTFHNFLLAVPVTALMVLLSGSGMSFVSYSAEGFGLVLYLGVITSGIAFLIFNNGIKLIGVSGAAINQLAFPAVAVIISYFYLGELINLAEAFGMLLIVAGIIVAQVLSK